MNYRHGLSKIYVIYMQFIYQVILNYTFDVLGKAWKPLKGLHVTNLYALSYTRLSVNHNILIASTGVTFDPYLSRGLVTLCPYSSA